MAKEEGIKRVEGEDGAGGRQEKEERGSSIVREREKR